MGVGNEPPASSLGAQSGMPATTSGVGKRAPSRSGGRPPLSGATPLNEALAPAGKKKTLKTPDGLNSNGSGKGRAQLEGGGSRAARASGADEPDEKPKKLKKKVPVPERDENDTSSGRMLNGRDGESKASSIMLSAVKKAVPARIPRRVPSVDSGGAASQVIDRTNPTSAFQPGSGGDRVGPSILAGLKAGSLTKPPSKKLPAPKTGPWRKIIMPTPQHIEWRAPMEYGFSVSGGGGWGSFDDDEPNEEVVEIPEDQVLTRIRIRIERTRVYECACACPRVIVYKLKYLL